MLVVEKNIASDPSDIGLLGAIRIIIETDPVAEWVQQLFGFLRVARWFCLRHKTPISGNIL